MTVHAFADESRRGCTYLVAVAIAEPGQLRQLRRELRGLLLPGQRELHFKREKEPRQRQIADAISRLPVDVRIYSRSCERNDEPARQDCVAQLTHDLVERGAHRLVIDSRSQRDWNDEVTIRRVVSRHPHPVPLVYEHVSSTSEAVLWVADAAAWCFNAGANWRRRMDKIISADVDLNQL
jgi:hypothetical protein